MDHLRLQAPEARAGALLSIDLDAVRANWRQLNALAAPGASAAVMKADAYGLGMELVAPALAREGCTTFFTAHVEEGMRLRRLVPDHAAIYVLHGPPAGVTMEFVAHDLIPVLNDPSQLADWRACARLLGRTLPAAIQFDTGMSRMGLAPADLQALLDDPALLAGIRPVLAMSHLACADEPAHPMNEMQRARFAATLQALRQRFPALAASLANSSGIFLGKGFHHDLARPGAALYGIHPQPGMGPNPLRQAVSLQARIVQSRTIAAGDCVGYGARHTANGACRIATIALGYADGWLRSLSGRGHAVIDGVRVPFAGNVSMDSITLDVTGIPEARVAAGMTVDLLCAEQTVDDVAREAGTIGYEVLTRLGSRFHRSYRGAA
jgi:alanine racemase